MSGSNSEQPWKCDGCKTTFSHLRRWFTVWNWEHKYNPKRDAWEEGRSRLCGYCFDNHKVWSSNAGQDHAS